MTVISHNPENERIKRCYIVYLEKAKGHTESTVDDVAKALNRFEAYTKYRNFKAFHPRQAISFKDHLAEQRSQRSGEKLSKSTLYTTLAHLKRFFQWLAGQSGYKSRLRYSDAEYFSLSGKEARIAAAHRERLFPTVEQIKHVINNMPTKTEIERRDRALIAFALLSGARDSAIASMKLKHVDLHQGCIHQDAREVQTKFSKTFDTFFFPVGDEIRTIVEGWIKYLREEKIWGNDDPLFPATRVARGASCQFEADGLERKHWSSAAPIRSIFRESFEEAGLPYFNPHSFRKTLVAIGETLCKTPEEFKAWSQNLGHEDVMTTFTSYGEIGNRRQGEIMKELATSQYSAPPEMNKLMAALTRELRKSERADPKVKEEIGVSIGRSDSATLDNAAAETTTHGFSERPEENPEKLTDTESDT